MSTKIKVYELAKELGLDSQALVDTVQRLGIDIKNPMSVLGSEEVRSVREYYRKNRPLTKSTPPAVTKSPVTEKRVGATVIRRRAKTPEKLEAPAQGHEEEREEAEEVSEQVAASLEAVDSPSELEPEVPSSSQTAEEEVVIAAAPQKPAVEEEKRGRKFFPSIIKKVAVETHLGQVVGPKPTKKEEAPKGGIAATKPSDDKSKTAPVGPRRLNVIELVQPEVAKEAKRRVMQRQDSVFKSADYLKRELIHATKKKKTVINRPAMKTNLTMAAQHKRVVEMGDTISVADLAKEMGIKVTAVIAKLMELGVTATINQPIDHDTAVLCAQEFKHEVKQKVFKQEDFLTPLDLSPENLQPRPPVVTIMGHVDHGKTSLLDAIRKTKVAAGEAGGITQHVGAYTVEVPKGKITFVDTPGHEAFTAMRARGAKVTDIVILVVSAVDGVMPQTLESVSHAKAANVPIIVAVNKIDLPDGNPDRIKQNLAGHGLNPEEWGGDTIYVSVSAKTGQGLDKLLESILLQAELLELKANYVTQARGTVIESRLDKNRGPVASILVQHGKLKLGDIIVCGPAFGKVRAMSNAISKKVTEALPSDPVEILGLPNVPNVGDDVFAVSDERKAREFAAAREALNKEKAQEVRPKMTLEEMMASGSTDDQELRVILRADVQGSAEALREAMSKFPQTKVKLKILHTGTGGISESDVMLAAASRAVILGFNIRPDLKAQKLAESEGVTLKTYNIIYDLLEDVKKFLEGLLEVVVKERVIGRAEIRNVFHIPKVGAVAGSAVIDGKILRNCYLRLLRDSRVIYEGKISSLRRFKEDVREVASGFECGIGLENFNDLKDGDQLEAFVKEESKGVL